MYLQKGLAYFYSKVLLPHPLFLLSYNPALNGQILSLFEPQTHL